MAGPRPGVAAPGVATVAPGPSTAADHEWLWEALVMCRHAHTVVMNLAPPDFDWNSAHPVHGTPLMAVVNEIIRSGMVVREVRPMLIWCLRQGADPRRTAVNARGYSGGWGNGSEEFPHVPRVPHAGRCAITLVLSLIGVLERISVYEHKGKYQDQLLTAKHLLSVFAEFRPTVPRRHVAEAAVDMWASIKADAESADVELYATGGGEGSQQHGAQAQGPVHAHSLVLCNASPVLRASLNSSMREGQERTLEVPGASKAALELLMSILYSGTLPPEVPASRPRGDWACDDLLEANWHGMGRWWAGQVVMVHDDGSCDILYEDDSSAWQEERVPPCRLRPRQGGQGSTLGGRAAPPCPTTVEQAQILLMALDIAHRWQVDHAVSLLEQSLSQHLRGGQTSGWFSSVRDYPDHAHTFANIVEAAVLKELPALRAACQEFARNAPEVHRQYGRGAFGAGTLVGRELQQLFE